MWDQAFKERSKTVDIYGHWTLESNHKPASFFGSQLQDLWHYTSESFALQSQGPGWAFHQPISEIQAKFAVHQLHMGGYPVHVHQRAALVL